MDNITRGGFAIRACYADHRQLAGRPVVICSSQPGQGLTRVFESNVWDAESAQFPVAYNRSGPVLDAFCM